MGKAFGELEGWSVMEFPASASVSLFASASVAKVPLTLGASPRNASHFLPPRKYGSTVGASRKRGRPRRESRKRSRALRGVSCGIERALRRIGEDGLQHAQRLPGKEILAAQSDGRQLRHACRSRRLSSFENADRRKTPSSHSPDCLATDVLSLTCAAERSKRGGDAWSRGRAYKCKLNDRREASGRFGGAGIRVRLHRGRPGFH